MNTRRILALALLLASTATAHAAPKYELRWAYSQTNLQVAANADQLIALLVRMRKAGYNGLVLADFKLNILDRVPDHYFTNLRRVKFAADRLGIEIIPTVCPIGYSEGLLIHDPNLAEGIPVRNAPAVVRNGRVALRQGDSPTLANGSLEKVNGNRFTGFYVDDPGKASFADTDITHSGNVACRMQDMGKHNEAGNCRLIQTLAVRPYSCYRLSVWVKTRNLASADAFKLLAMGAGNEKRPLTSYAGALERTQDWTRKELVFNTLDNDKISVYAGVWAGTTGTLWLDDMKLQELFLVNVLRRRGCPLTVTSEDGQTTFQEGRDFHEVRDPKLGNDPNRGDFGFQHDAPEFRLTNNSRIREGQKLRVSWYHPVKVYGYQVVSCLSEEKVFDILTDQIKLVQRHLQPKRFFMAHDEIRVANWCKTCQDRKQTPGKLLADNVRRCVGIIQKINPRAEVIVWSDMFDPHHNAVEEKFYLANGPLTGSWSGLPKRVDIANWNQGKAAQSARWFEKQGHQQIIAGYYDTDITSFRRWERATKGLEGVRGFMYTTWQKKYDHLEEYGKAMWGN